MKLDVLCKQGKLQITDDSILQVVAPFKKLVWSIPCAVVTNITVQPGSIGAVNVTFHTTQGIFQAETISKPNLEKLQAIFQMHVDMQQPAPKVAKVGKEWYHNPNITTYVATYTNEKQMQKEVQEAGKYGWIPQGTAGTAGHVNVGRTAARVALLGPAVLLFGASRSKDKITITYVRQPQQPQ
jgi:hypothetical protein